MLTVPQNYIQLNISDFWQECTGDMCQKNTESCFSIKHLALHDEYLWSHVFIGFIITYLYTFVFVLFLFKICGIKWFPGKEAQQGFNWAPYSRSQSPWSHPGLQKERPERCKKYHPFFPSPTPHTTQINWTRWVQMGTGTPLSSFQKELISWNLMLANLPEKTVPTDILSFPLYHQMQRHTESYHYFSF